MQGKGENWKMIRLKQKRITELLRQSFQEEAQNVEPPPCQKLWKELQQRPEFINTASKAEQFFLEQSNREKSRQAFWKKYRPLASFIAAGVFMAIFLTQLLPLINHRDTLLPEHVSAPDTGPQAEGTAIDSDATLFTAENDAAEPAEKFSLRSTVEEKLPSQPAAGRTGQAEKEQAGQQETTFMRQEQSISRQEGTDNNSRLDRNSQPPLNEHLFKEAASFTAALADAQGLTDEEIWQVKFSPENYNFQEGEIIQTESSLLLVSQEFTDKEGHRFSLRQQFTPDITGEEREFPAAASVQSPAQPLQVGSYPGYLFRPSPGVYMLTWQQEKSTVTLEGELAEELLYEIVATLGSPAGGLIE